MEIQPIKNIWRRLPASVRYTLWGQWHGSDKFDRLTAQMAGEISRDLTQVLRADGDRSSFVVLPTQTWFSSGFQRPQQLAKALAEYGHPTIFCEPWKASKILVTNQTKVGRRFVRLRRIASNLWLLRCPTEMLKGFIEKGSPDAILLNWPNQAHFVPEALVDRVVYDIIDDHSLYPNADDNWRQTHEYWVRQAQVVTATADDLIGQLRPWRSDVLLVPNGVRTEDWTGEAREDCPADFTPARKANVVVGYYGALGEWFDWNMWLGAAARRPEWSFVLIGYAYDGNTDAIHERLRGSMNTFYLGPKRYEELPHYLRHIDVATIPFILNDITHGCSPVKLFEYMAAGKPVVCSPMREVLKYRSIFIASTAEEFVQNIEKALSKRRDPEYQALLHREAAENTWRDRAELISSAVLAARQSIRISGRDAISYPQTGPESAVLESSC